MNTNKLTLIIFSLISTATFAAEERSEIKFDTLPEAVRNTVSHVIDQKNITQIEKVSDNGYVKFEVKSTKTVNNKDLVDTDLTIASDGEIMTLAKEAPVFNIPFPVMNKLTQRYPGLKVDEVQIVQTRYFLLTGKTNGQALNLKVYDDGDIEEISSDQNQSEPDKLIQDQPLKPLPDTYQETIPSMDDELQIDRSDYNFNPNQND